MSDDSLSGVSGRDGLTLNIEYPKTGLQANFVQLNNSSDARALDLSGFSMQSVDATGLNVGTQPLGMLNILDAYTDGNGVPGASLQLSWDRMRLRINAFCGGSTNTSCSANGGASAGTLVYDAGGHLNLFGHGGLFNLDNDNASMDYQLTNATMFYRQAAADPSGKLPEVVFRNFNLQLTMPTGTVGIDKNQGIVISSQTGSKVHLDSGFDLGFDPAPASPFVLGSTDQFALHYGYVGDVEDLYFTLNGGGTWESTSLIGSGNTATYDMNGTVTPLKSGIRESLRFNQDPNFIWTIGDADNGTGQGVAIQFLDWTKLTAPTVSGANPYDINIPLMAVDVVDATHYPGGLCFGADWSGPAAACLAHAANPLSLDYPSGGANYVDIDPTQQGLGIILRNGSIRSYPTTVTAYDPHKSGCSIATPSTCEESYNWTLISTAGDLDGNVFLYPGGNSFNFDLPIGGEVAKANANPITATSVGLHGDLILTNQTFDSANVSNPYQVGSNWANGTHFMIGETDASDPNSNMAIGWMNANVLLAAKGLYLNIVPAGSSPTDKAQYARVNFNSSLLRVHLEGTFGGGTLPDMAQSEQMSIWNINLESDGASLSMHPHILCTQAADPGCAASKSNGVAANGSYATAQDIDGFIHVTNTDVPNFSEYVSSNPANPDAGDYGSYVSLAEPSRPTSDFRIANISGFMELHETLDLQAEGQGVIGPWNQDTTGNGAYFINNTGKPRLIVDATMMLGQAATMPAGVTADVVRGDRVMFGGDDLGSIVIPGATIHSITTLTPQTW